MTPQEKELYALLKYASTKMHQTFNHEPYIMARESNTQFHTEKVFSIDNQEWKDRMYGSQSVTIDFAQRKISWYAAHTSYVSGNGYSERVGEVEWDSYLPYAYETLLPKVKDHLLHDIRTEELKKIEEGYKLKVEQRLEEMLNQ